MRINTMLIISLVASILCSCGKVEEVPENAGTGNVLAKLEDSLDESQASSEELEYFELRTLNDTGILLYDMYTNEGTGGRVGDVHWTLDIVDPNVYGKVASDVLQQVYLMGSQIDLENQMNQMQEGAEIEGRGTLHDLNLFVSTEYTTVESQDWAFCMQNYSIEETAYNSMFGVTQWGNKWIVFNLLSEIPEDSQYVETDKKVYLDFYNAYNLDTTILEPEMIYNM